MKTSNETLAPALRSDAFYAGADAFHKHLDVGVSFFDLSQGNGLHGDDLADWISGWHAEKTYLENLGDGPA